ncbi:hypothetical protein XU06_30330 (plasmid) [Rhodococcus erythropolis]|uniref:acyl-CoA dehydrogenase C-terminal domain-containing protein n=1 Tax=Rhodococcus erythropolis TaxID=1833 RepID=UPI00061B5FE6|nr:acyl-CoA dehydrogenase C-terminal domain-containing protein [Rhodococcus erythropolis]AKE01225.1 hypothetical protein XU06_30330 [Rhodococcus erythropolis]
MLDYTPPSDDLKFVLNDVLDVAQYSTLPSFESIDADLVASTIEAFGDFAARELAPLNAEGDRVGAALKPDGVESAPGFADAYRTYVAGGWPALVADPEHGGDGMPAFLQSVLEEILAGSNMAFAMAPLTAPGAYRVLNHSASAAIKNTYLAPIASGRWGTAMSLTEAQGGSALALLRTRAEPNDDGSYRITGTKIFNSWGDHDMAENIVHLVLARLPEAPAGTKGISLFVVPKYLPGENGDLGERNAFSVGSLEKKMGLHASPTCVTNFDGATGYLVGTEHKGMAAMFIIMNSMRLATGSCAIGIADAAYHNALAYARERVAARSLTGTKYPDLPGDPIIVQPDVRRMLMTQKALVEGGRALCYWVAVRLSLSETHPDLDERRDHDATVSLLTPVVKAFLSDKGFESADLALQCFGGHGYVQDNGAEQYLRDIRMLRIGEGTSGIQAMDFIGRKTLADNARTLNQYLDTVRQDVTALPSELVDIAHAVTHALDTVTQITKSELAQWKQDPETMGAIALDYLHMVGYVALGHMWAKMAATNSSDVERVRNKQRTARYYCAHLLPEIETLAHRVRAGGATTMAIPDGEF